MGFGLLFIGYFVAFLMSFNPYGFAFRIVGYYIIFTALGKLSEYKKCISRCLIPLLVMTLCSVAEGVDVLLPSVTYPEMLSSLISAVNLAVNLVFHIYLLIAVRELGKDTEENGIADFAVRDITLVLIYTVFNAGAMLFGTVFHLSNRYVTLILSLYSIVYPIFMLILFYRCYAGICAPEDADMPVKPSRFAFINKQRKKSEEKEHEVKQLVNEMQEKKKNKHKPK